MPGAADTADRPDYPESPRPLDQAAAQPDQSEGRSLARLKERLDNLPDGHPSSPRNDDGSQRAPAVRLRDLELPDEDAPSDPEVARRTGDQPQAPDAAEANAQDLSDDAVSGGWRAGMPALKAAWETHLERWPEADRAPVDRSTDEPGSWRGDGGQYLNTEENIVTDHGLDRVHKTEDSINEAVRSVEAEIPGACLVGLDHCLKGEDRFKEKVSYETRAKPDKSIGEIVNDIPDAIRYTYQFETASYVEGYWATHDKLLGHGYEMEFCRNSWEDPQYRGINTRWREPDGQLFEVQFHTPESFVAKEFTHQAYERIRSSDTSDIERDELHDFQKEASALIPAPADVSSIPNYRKKEIDGNR